jgi:hypothetical protein
MHFGQCNLENKAWPCSLKLAFTCYIIYLLYHNISCLWQFVELKGSVFKKFDKNNLFQVSCSDVRERFHLFALLFIVVVQTMKEYGWKEGNFLPYVTKVEVTREYFLTPYREFESS